MPRIRHFLPAAAAGAFLLLLSGCDQLRSTEPPPSFESPTVGVAREIGDAQATPAEKGSSASAASK